MEDFQIIVDVEKSGAKWHLKNKEGNGEIKAPLELIQNIFDKLSKSIEREMIINATMQQLDNMMVNRKIRRNIEKNIKFS